MIEFIILALVVYRVSRMLALERGAFNLFENVRALALERFGDDHWITEGVSCPRCQSFWWGLVAAFVLPFANPIELVVHWLALSGLATLLYGIEQHHD